MEDACWRALDGGRDLFHMGIILMRIPIIARVLLSA
jgi:hypothetical protein